MQWRDATVGGKNTTGFETSCSGALRQQIDVRQIQVGYVDQAKQVRQVSVPDTGEAGWAGGSDQLAAAGSKAALPAGFDLPCRQDPELFFSDAPQDVEQAKDMCRGCRARLACLAGALERREACGVWGGELLMRGAIVPVKRPRGRPRKTKVAA
jgi:WhiB family redox-sensing transcriptional regulator